MSDNPYLDASQPIDLPRQPLSHDPSFDILTDMNGHINGEIGTAGSNPQHYS